MGDANDKHRSGEHRADCDQLIDNLEKRVTTLEQADKANSEKLHAGELLFVGIQKDIETLTKAVTGLSDSIRDAIRWVLGIVGTAAAGGILWAIIESSKAVK